MGFMGLDTHLDSDAAGDLHYAVVKSMLEVLNKGMDYRGNSYNTCGFVNVALVIESGLLDSIDGHLIDKLLETNKLLTGLEDLNKHCEDKSNWKDQEDRLFYAKHFARMTKSVKKRLKRKETIC